MSLFEEILEEIDLDKRNAKTFGELSPELQKKFNDNLLPKAISEEMVIDLRKNLLSGLTGSELMKYFNKRFQGTTVPEKFLTAKRKLITILLEDL